MVRRRHEGAAGGTSCGAALHSSTGSQLSSGLPQLHASLLLALVYVSSAAQPGSANAFMSHGGLKECSWRGTNLQANVFSLNYLCSLFVLQL